MWLLFGKLLASMGLGALLSYVAFVLLLLISAYCGLISDVILVRASIVTGKQIGRAHV